MKFKTTLKSLITSISKLNPIKLFQRKKFNPIDQDFSMQSDSKSHSKNNRKHSKNLLSQLSWDDLLKNFFSPSFRPRIHKVFSVLAIVIFTYGIGKTTGLLLDTIFNNSVTSKTSENITSTRDLAKIKKQASLVRSSNLFNVADKSPLNSLPKQIIAALCFEAQIRSSLPLQLKSTIVLQNNSKSLASIQVRGAKDLDDFREGDTIKDIAKIGKNQVIFRNLQTNECEYTANQEKEVRSSGQPLKFLSEEKGKNLLRTNNQIRQDGNKYIIKKSFRDDMLKDMNEVLTQARAVQMKNPDGSLSFKITEIVPGSIYSQLNILDGDVISTINGKKIQNLNEIMTLFGNIKDIDQLSLGVRRNDVEEEMDYQFD
jgi:type II secretory pathway component PulC